MQSFLYMYKRQHTHCSLSTASIGPINLVHIKLARGGEEVDLWWDEHKNKIILPAKISQITGYFCSLVRLSRDLFRHGVGHFLTETLGSIICNSETTESYDFFADFLALSVYFLAAKYQATLRVCNGSPVVYATDRRTAMINVQSLRDRP